MNRRTSLVCIISSLVLIPQLALAQGIEDYIIELTQFLNGIVLPTLFAIAFLVFLVNITRYFIIQGASEEGREKAKRNALWGIAAFVLLLSLWTITTLLLQGLGLSDREDAICPDYLSNFGYSGGCNEASSADISRGSFEETSFPAPAPPSSGGGSSFSGSAGTSGANTGQTNSTGGSGGATNSNNTTNNQADDNTPFIDNLAELILGTGEDSASIISNSVVAAAKNQTVNIAEAASCTEALTELRTYAREGTNQAAYIYYEDDNGSHWLEVTDTTSETGVGYDRGLLTNINNNSNNSNIHLFHTHPSRRTERLNLDMSGHGPSHADFYLMCNLNMPTIVHHVVDERGVWSYEVNNNTCPYDRAETSLVTIETYLALSQLSSSQRKEELANFIKSPLTSPALGSEFTRHVDNVNSYQSQFLQDLSLPDQRATDTFVSYEFNIPAFCNTL